MKYVLQKRRILFIILFSQAFNMLFSVSVFAEEDEKKAPLVLASESEASAYKGLIPGFIMKINKKRGILQVSQEHNGKYFSIEVPIENVPKHYIIKEMESVQALMAKDSTGYDPNIHMITDVQKIREALAYGLYDSIPEDPEKAANLDKIAPIKIKDK